MTHGLTDREGGIAGRAILVARGAIFPRLGRMGAKYLPTHRDLQASRRFQQKQNPLRKFKPAPAKKGKRK